MKKIVFRLVFTLLITATAAAGLFFSLAYYRGIEQGMRAELLKSAQNLSVMLNANRIRALAGAPSDAGNPSYIRLKKQLIAALPLYPGARFIYLMGRRGGGEVFFYADSEAEGSKDESPPGQIYEEADQEFIDVFTSQRPAVTGPVSDRWGTFMSALVSVRINSGEGGVVVLGVDVEAGRWGKIALIKTLPVILFFGFMALFLCAVLVMAEKKKNSRGSVVASAAVFCAACVTFLAVYNHEQEKRHNLEILSELSSAAFKTKITELKQLRDIKMEALKSFFNQSDFVSSEEFSGFVSFMKPGPAAVAWFWMEKNEGKYSLKYTAGNPESAPDMMIKEAASGAETASAIAETEKTGLPVISAPFESKACVVWKHRGSRQQGVIGALVDFESFTALQGGEWHREYSGCLHMFDATDGSRIILNGLNKANPERVPNPGQGIFDTRPGEFFSALFFLGRVYQIYIHNDSKMPQSGALWKTMAGGTAAAVLIIAILNMALLRRQELVAMVEQRARQLRENEVLTISTLQSIADGVLIFDREGRVLSANRAALDITGLRAENIMRKELLKMREFVFAHEGAIFDPEMVSVIQEARVVTPHKGVRLIEGTCAPARNEKSELTGYVMAFRDITGRAEAAKAALQHRERLQSLVNILSENKASVQEFLDYALDEAVRITSSSIGYILFYDEEKKEFELNSWSKEVMKECEITEKQTKYYLEKTGIWGDAVRERRHIMINDFDAPDPGKKGYPKGHVKINRFLTIPVFEGSRIVAVVGVANKKEPYDDTDILQLKLLMKSVWEISARKKAEMELKASLEKIAGLFSAAPIGMGVVIDREFTEVNPYMEELTGYRREELIGKKSIIVYPDEGHFEKAGEIKYQMMKESGRGSVETRWKRKDGVIIDIFLSSAWVDSDDTSKGAIFTALDITDRKAAENKLKQLVEELRKIDSMKSNFISMVSHELRTPLTSIKGFLSLLLRGAAGDLNERQRDFLETAAVNSERLLKLINDILDISKLESGNFEIKKEKWQAADAIRDVLKEVSILAEKKEILLVENTAAGAEVFADRFRVTQVLANLVMNSLKFSPEKTTIYVTMSQPGYTVIKDRAEKAGIDVKPGQYAFFSVKDEGRGIEKEHISRLFDRFFQIQEGDSKVYKGVGLGLYICRQIVEKHCGYIWAESEGDKTGAEFVFLIPAE